MKTKDWMKNIFKVSKRVKRMIEKIFYFKQYIIIKYSTVYIERWKSKEKNKKKHWEKE